MLHVPKLHVSRFSRSLHMLAGNLDDVSVTHGLFHQKAVATSLVAIIASDIKFAIIAAQGKATVNPLHCTAEVAPELSKIGFEVFLLPSPEHRQVWHSAARFPDNGALQPDAPATLDDETIDGLLTEVRQVISSAKFGSAVKVSNTAQSVM